MRVLQVVHMDGQELPFHCCSCRTGVDQPVDYCSHRTEADQTVHHSELWEHRSVLQEAGRLVENSSLLVDQAEVHTDQQADQMAGDTDQDIHDHAELEEVQLEENIAILGQMAIQEVQMEEEDPVAEHKNHTRLVAGVRRMLVHPTGRLVPAEVQMAENNDQIGHLEVGSRRPTLQFSERGGGQGVMHPARSLLSLLTHRTQHLLSSTRT